MLWHFDELSSSPGAAMEASTRLPIGVIRVDLAARWPNPVYLEHQTYGRMLDYGGMGQKLSFLST